MLNKTIKKPLRFFFSPPNINPFFRNGKRGSKTRVKTSHTKNTDIPHSINDDIFSPKYSMFLINDLLFIIHHFQTCFKISKLDRSRSSRQKHVIRNKVIEFFGPQKRDCSVR